MISITAYFHCLSLNRTISQQSKIRCVLTCHNHLETKDSAKTYCSSLKSASPGIQAIPKDALPGQFPEKTSRFWLALGALKFFIFRHKLALAQWLGPSIEE